MTILSLVFSLLSYLLLVILTGFRPRPPRISQYELRRRLKAGKPQALKLQVKIENINEVISLVRTFKAILIVIFSYLVIDSYDWLAGGSLVVVGLILLEVMARLKLVRQVSDRLRIWLESQLFGFVHLHGRYFRFLRGLEVWQFDDRPLDSRPELSYQIKRSQFLSSSEQQHLQAALKLESATAKSIMKSIDDQPTVSQNDLMGPLLLHELHQTGADTFPVTDSAKGTKIVGIITIAQLLSLDDKTSHKVKYYMNTGFPSFKLDTSVRDCLDKLLESKTFMGVVYDQDNQAQGVVTLETCWRAILGQSQ